MSLKSPSIRLVLATLVLFQATHVHATPSMTTPSRHDLCSSRSQSKDYAAKSHRPIIGYEDDNKKEKVNAYENKVQLPTPTPMPTQSLPTKHVVEPSLPFSPSPLPSLDDETIAMPFPPTPVPTYFDDAELDINATSDAPSVPTPMPTQMAWDLPFSIQNDTSNETEVTMDENGNANGASWNTSLSFLPLPLTPPPSSLLVNVSKNESEMSNMEENLALDKVVETNETMKANETDMAFTQPTTKNDTDADGTPKPTAEKQQRQVPKPNSGFYVIHSLDLDEKTPSYLSFHRWSRKLSLVPEANDNIWSLNSRYESATEAAPAFRQQISFVMSTKRRSNFLNRFNYFVGSSSNGKNTWLRLREEDPDRFVLEEMGEGTKKMKPKDHPMLYAFKIVTGVHAGKYMSYNLKKKAVVLSEGKETAMRWSLTPYTGQDLNERRTEGGK